MKVSVLIFAPYGVEAPEQLEAALRKAIAYEGPTLVEIIADPELI